ncbi:TNF receptor-associated factor 5 [Erinaceus europaeus]|uniref:TNF receptor-associated factor n=1 Tax=Erinaceus europaeus TaxID=9365 RepID=A0ABM3WCQ8_ERIEU|nr:TNF receptor-associated factor 5 [Erinaceus europaeus]XP_060034363.1 TNF receptor-associated factor 5 [Erinaceus europaeus]XP_060034364.1 TNF receptor-associated factor 5 [Erinaceus europaeus]
MATVEGHTGTPGFDRQNSSGAVSLDFEPDEQYHFLEQLEERYRCAHCRAVLHNPHQTGCGHRFCQRCIWALGEHSTPALCPVDKEVIRSQEVFRDNCCLREVLSLYVYCKNAPECPAKVTLGRYQDHLQQCPFQAVPCSNERCPEAVLRKDLEEHLVTHCQFREEKCPYCKTGVAVVSLQSHEENVCPKCPVSCPNKCPWTLPRTEVEEHLAVCPEAEQDCPFKLYGCSVKDKRANLQAHKHAALQDHMLMVLERNFRLEEQISDLYKSLEQKESKIQQLADTVAKFEKEFKQLTQLFGKNGSFLSDVQALASHMDRSAWLETQVRQLLQTASRPQSSLDLRSLVDAVDAVKQKVALLEAHDQRLGLLEGQSGRHDAHLQAHTSRLSLAEERCGLLEGARYGGRLVWKVSGYGPRKREAAAGRAVSIFSRPFYTGRCGYRLCARAYLNGDGSGRGSHLSLYFVVMRGDFDALLPWPFRQKVTLTLLDQSGRGAHVAQTFRPDPHSGSFRRPDGEMNVASGCPRFVPHATLESPEHGYVRDDTLFLKVAVDLSDLEDL